MSGVVTAIGVAASVASAAYSMSQGTPKARSAASDSVSTAAKSAAATRSQLLETAGGSAGEILTTGQTSSNGTLFGN